MLLSQIVRTDGTRAVVVRDGTEAHEVTGFDTTYALAMHCLDRGRTLAEALGQITPGRAVDLEQAGREGRILPPIDHPDPAHLYVTGTGLTHLGSASTRNSMHGGGDDEAGMTDSMKMFRMGLKGGKPAAGQVGVQPEWFPRDPIAELDIPTSGNIITRTRHPAYPVLVSGPPPAIWQLAKLSQGAVEALK